MTLTPEQIAKIRQKEADTPDALKRNPLNDYTEGWFHVTLNVRGEAPVLGYIVGDADAPDSSDNAPRCMLTELGKKVEEEWQGVGRFYPECICEEIQIMPEHVHALLHLLPTNRAHLGRIINGLMIGCTHAYWNTLGIQWSEMRKQLEETLKRKIGNDTTLASAKAEEKALCAKWQDRDHTRSFRGPSLFVRGYNDVEAIGEEEIEIKREYIRDNPRKRLIQRGMPECFRVRRDMRSANWTPERILRGFSADRFIGTDRYRQEEAWRQVTEDGIRNSRGKMSAKLKSLATPGAQPSPGADGVDGVCSADGAPAVGQQRHGASTWSGGTWSGDISTICPVLDLVGNMELLKRPLFSLICHRADAHLFEQQKARVLKVAREQGGVIVTACVSSKEREIVKLLQQELLPVIEVMGNGFSDRYKPTGRNFYAVAEGRRLEVSPWQYAYRQREQQIVRDGDGRPVLGIDGQPEMEDAPDITREMCMVMNEVVRTIARTEDDWWKK